MILQIGKYKGKDIEEVPLGYLVWFESNTNPAPPLREAINAEIKIRTADESSIGRSVESPTYTSFEEMLHKEIMLWLSQQYSANRLTTYLSSKHILEISLAKMLKVQVPRLKKLYRSQTKT